MTKRTGPKPRSLEERFWPKVDKNGPIQPHMDTCCWPWLGSIMSNGYGYLYNGEKGANQTAHHASWTIHNGPLKKGRRVLHRCDYTLCVRPDHLFEGSQRDNVLDAISKGRWTQIERMNLCNPKKQRNVRSKRKTANCVSIGSTLENSTHGNCRERSKVRRNDTEFTNCEFAI